MAAARKRKSNGAVERKSNGCSGARNAPARTGYGAFEELGGQKYTGMRAGRGHQWQHDAGEWVEKKVTPDRRELEYDVVKRRRGKAPEGSDQPRAGTRRRAGARRGRVEGLADQEARAQTAALRAA